MPFFHSSSPKFCGEGGNKIWRKHGRVKGEKRKIDEDFEELLRKIKDKIIMKKRGKKLRIRKSDRIENVERNRKR